MATAEQLLPDELRKKEITCQSKLTLIASIITAVYTLGVTYYGLFFTWRGVKDNNDICWNQLEAPSLAVLLHVAITVVLTILAGHLTCLYQNYVSWYQQEGVDYRLFWTVLFRINFTTLTLISFTIFASQCYYFWSLYTLGSIFNILFYAKYSI